MTDGLTCPACPEPLSLDLKRRMCAVGLDAATSFIVDVMLRGGLVRVALTETSCDVFVGASLDEPPLVMFRRVPTGWGIVPGPPAQQAQEPQ